jgi:hypothetical protein
MNTSERSDPVARTLRVSELISAIESVDWCDTDEGTQAGSNARNLWMSVGRRPFPATLHVQGIE